MKDNCGSVPADDKSGKMLPKASVASEATRKSPPDIPRISTGRVA